MRNDQFSVLGRRVIGIFIFIFGIGAVAVSVGAVLIGLEKTELIDMDKVRGYPFYRL